MLESYQASADTVITAVSFTTCIFLLIIGVLIIIVVAHHYYPPELEDDYKKLKRDYAKQLEINKHLKDKL